MVTTNFFFLHAGFTGSFRQWFVVSESTRIDNIRRIVSAKLDIWLYHINIIGNVGPVLSYQLSQNPKTHVIFATDIGSGQYFKPSIRDCIRQKL